MIMNADIKHHPPAACMCRGTEHLNRPFHTAVVTKFSCDLEIRPAATYAACMCGPHAQAFGAGNLHMMSVMLVRAQLVCMVSVLPTLLLWSSGALARWLPLLGQQADIAEPASRCVHDWTAAHGLLPA
jgi:hypothetical protein